MVDQNLEDISSVKKNAPLSGTIWQKLSLEAKHQPFTCYIEWRKVVSKAHKLSEKVSTRPTGGRLTDNRPFAGLKRGSCRPRSLKFGGTHLQHKSLLISKVSETEGCQSQPAGRATDWNQIAMENFDVWSLSCLPVPWHNSIAQKKNSVTRCNSAIT